MSVLLGVNYLLAIFAISRNTQHASKPRSGSPTGPWACPGCTADAKPLTTAHIANMLEMEVALTAVVTPPSIGTSPVFEVHLMDADAVSKLTYRKALACTDKAEWRTAIAKELSSIADFGTWHLEPVPDARYALGTKWVFKVKRTSTGDVERFKARLVVLGFHQKLGVDYHDTFAPVATYTTLRWLLAVAAALNYELLGIDFTNAFCNSNMDHPVWLKIPSGFRESLTPSQVQLYEDMRARYGARLSLRLLKGLYGLKQSPMLWNKTLHTFLVSPTMGFTQCTFDPCLYWRRETDGTVTLLLVYVDDTILACKSPSTGVEFNTRVAQHYKIRELGDVEWILGMRVCRDREQRTLTLDQTQYITQLLVRFGMENSNPVTTPAVKRTPLTDATEPSPLLDAKIPYRAAVGALMHAAVGTRPDLAFAVSQVSRYSAQPRVEHWAMVQRIFRYLRGSTNLALGYSPTSSSGTPSAVLHGYVDSDWAGTGDALQRRSTSGYILMVGSMPICWRSKLQPTTALSSTEAEYMAASIAAQEIMWLRQLTAEVNMGDSAPTDLAEDNEGCIALARQQTSGGRTKHIAVKWHFVRQCIAAGDLILRSVPSADNLADLLTKAVTTPVFRLLIDRLLTLVNPIVQQTPPTASQ